MGVKVKIFDIVHVNSFKISIKEGETAYPIDEGFFELPTIYPQATEELVIDNYVFAFNTQYWIKIRDIVNDTYVIKNIHINDPLIYSGCGASCLLVGEAVLVPSAGIIPEDIPVTPSVTPTKSILPTPTPTPTRTPILTCNSTLNVDYIMPVVGTEDLVEIHCNVAYGTCSGIKVEYKRSGQENWFHQFIECDASPVEINIGDNSGYWIFRLTVRCTNFVFSINPSIYHYYGITPTPTPTPTTSSLPIEWDIFIKLLIAGKNTGPFDIYYSNDNGATFILFEKLINVEKQYLLQGIKIQNTFNINDVNSLIRIKSKNECRNFIDIPVISEEMGEQP